MTQKGDFPIFGVSTNFNTRPYMGSNTLVRYFIFKVLIEKEKLCELEGSIFTFPEVEAY